MFITILFAPLITLTSFPIGTYYANVRIPMISNQEIYVDVNENLDGKIYLKGLITQEEFFNYDHKLEKPILGDKITKLLNKYNCRILNIQYDNEKDFANVKLTLPILGNMSLKLHRVKS